MEIELKACSICKVEVPRALLKLLIDSISSYAGMCCPKCMLEFCKKRFGDGYEFDTKLNKDNYAQYIVWMRSTANVNTCKRT